ncbi:MAG: hypothetical protein QNJ38_19365 [Prochloraceae cyanobacterium]|nr:hypothetical protein [Prochloraceae cyanobacterium]
MKKKNKEDPLSKQELAIVNYLKLRKFCTDADPPEIELVSDVQIAADLEITQGAQQLLEGLAAKGVVKCDRQGNWGLSDRVDYQQSIERAAQTGDSAEAEVEVEPVKEVKIDPEFKSLIIPLTEEERSLLEADLIEHGCLDPLIVWLEENVFLDGHNRHEICSKHNIKYQIKYLSFRDREAAKEWMLKKQLGRRNLTNESLSYYRGQLYNTLKNKVRNPTGQNQYLVDDINQLWGQNDPKAGIENQTSVAQKNQRTDRDDQKARTAEKLAEEYRVGSKTIKRDGEYAAAVDTLVERVDLPELRPALLSKKFKLSKIDTRKLAKEAIEHPEIVKQAYNSNKSGKDWVKTVQHQIKKLTEEPLESFPFEKDDVVIIRAAEDSEYELRARSSYWGVVEEVKGKFSCSVLVYDGVLENVRATELEDANISADLKKSAIALMNRLQKIAEIEIVDPMVNEVLCGIGKRKMFDLPVVQNKILNLIEEELGMN